MNKGFAGFLGWKITFGKVINFNHSDKSIITFNRS